MASATTPTTAQSSKPLPMPGNATIYMVRHAEKPASGTGLSPAGQQRADAYVKYFQGLQNPEGNTIHWDHLFACKDSDNSDRPLLTLTPLAAKLGKKIHCDFKDKDYAAFADFLKQNANTYAGNNLLICWHHGEILNLAEAMGVSFAALPPSSNWPAKWNGEAFGWLLKIYFKQDGTIHHSSTVAVNEHLMPDDTIDPVYGK